jgi:hypothetical protein
LLGIASTELAWAYILSILAAIFCVIYGAVKWNDAGPYTEELQALDEWAPEQKD